LFVGTLALVAVPRTAAALSIVPHFETTGTAALTAADQAVINNAIGFYTSTFTDPITINIEFHFDAAVFGQSAFFVDQVSYTQYRAALIADGKSADDATADATLPAGPGLPAPLNPTGSQNMNIKIANGLAVGLNTPELTNTCNQLNATYYSGAVSGCIGVGIHASNTYLIAVVEHEIDEIMGLGSALFPSGILNNQIMPEDLFRFSANGTRDFARNSSCAGPIGQGPLAYFSIDNGATNLDTFNNCNNGGDYGDWITHSPSQVQDAFTTLNGVPTLDGNTAETRALDVIGWDRAVAPVPEPMSLVLLGSGLISASVARRRAQRKK
jgi:hypothetical protein